MKRITLVLAFALASIALVACGGSSSSSTSVGDEATSQGAGTEGQSSSLDIAAAATGLAYSSDTATASAGDVTVNFDNPQTLEHDVAIEDSGGKVIGKTEVITQGSDSTTVQLKPGTYVYFCTVPGHREGGMKGTLTVK